MKTFDELFNEFFKRNNIKPEDKISDTLRDEAKKMIDILTKIKNLDEDIHSIDEEIEKSIDEELGKPDKIEFFNEDNLFYERRIWHTPNGDLIKLLISDDPTLINAPKFEKPLQEQLDEAVAEENYEKAAAIRDRMNPKKKITKKAK
jgi:hypothetical protein